MQPHLLSMWVLETQTRQVRKPFIGPSSQALYNFILSPGTAEAAEVWANDKPQAMWPGSGATRTETQVHLTPIRPSHRREVFVLVHHETRSGPQMTASLLPICREQTMEAVSIVFEATWR